eukprot:maker-scaffold590_size129399-snap-gene-0.34 protein:Tk08104 transcript:maker-scaffold590_size129399-snap-gene-0.34-mRNA-1 annotation:"phospholipase-like protein group"
MAKRGMPFHFSHANAGKIDKTVKALMPTSAVGANGISVSVLKMDVGLLASPLAYLMNKSLSCGVVPAGFKIGSRFELRFGSVGEDMKSLLVHLLSLLLLLGHVSSLPNRSKRSVGQFGDMIRYATGREALLYNEYGNHCGYQGNATEPVVDDVDQCCYDHDRCYERIDTEQCSSSWVGPSWVFYDWKWDLTRLLCLDESSSCDFHVCLCDKMAAECFQRNTWNADHKKRSEYDGYAELRWRAFEIFGTWFP